MATIFILLSQNDTQSLTYSEVKKLFYDEKVSYFTVEGDNLILTLREPVNGSFTATYKLYSVSIFYEDLNELIEQQEEAGIITGYDYDVGWEAPWWLTFVPYILIFVVFGVVWYFILNKGAGGDKGAMRLKARTRLASNEKNKVTFNDVAGADEEKRSSWKLLSF